MSINIRLATSGLCLAVATLSIAMATGACMAADTPAIAGAAAPAAQQPAPKLEELGTIWVRGKRLATAITDAEDDFFRLYNQLNKNSDYDITCGYMSLNRGSMIMKRTCLPGFVADRLKAATRTYMVSEYSGGCFGGSPVVSHQDMNGDTYYTADYSSMNCATVIAPVAYVQPPVALLVMERRDDYVNNQLNVINSDLRLRYKYEYLVGLYHEMDSVQQHYVEVRKEKGLELKPNRGPRVL